jgi:glycosyltransferase involved in cell wall biosynthesis
MQQAWITIKMAVLPPTARPALLFAKMKWKSMKQKSIFIDGLALMEGHFSGIGQYVLGVLRGLDELIEDAKYAGADVPDIKVIIPRDTVYKFKTYEFRHIGYKKFPLSFRYMAALWHRGKLPPIDLWCGRGTYIFTRFVDMPLLFSKSALVIYDLSFELHRQYSDERNAIFLSKFTRKSVNRSKKVIAISKSVEKEIADFYNLPQSKLAMAYPATDPKLFYRRSPKEIAQVKQKYNIKTNYILALSNLEPRKNLSALVDAYCELPKALRDEYALLLVGVNGWKTETLFNHIIKKVDEGFNIIRPSDFVLDKDKPAIISGASVLVYPSHYEGFGMPPLEAAACGVPVIAAKNSSLPEAVGSAGKLIDIDEPGRLASTMEDLLNNIESARNEAVVQGPAHAKTFSWKRSAQIFLDVAKEVES